jgi:hypothetical protein
MIYSYYEKWKTIRTIELAVSVFQIKANLQVKRRTTSGMDNIVIHHNMFMKRKLIVMAIFNRLSVP